ncbi:MAG: hypothetical protein OYG32_04865 [Rhodospirillaceae bacterium]|nr:hypothetical protein [Rhodospirillaceae bacterium]
MQIRIFLAALAAAFAPFAGLAADPPPGHAWIAGMLAENPACDEPTAREIADAVRGGIEREVYRREDSIRPPSAAAELSCLGDLVRNPSLDRLFPTQASLTPGIPGFLTGLLKQLASSSGGDGIFDIDIAALASGAIPDPTRALSASLCNFAEDRWNAATLPVLDGFPEALAALARSGRDFATLPDSGGAYRRAQPQAINGASGLSRSSPDLPSRALGTNR